MVMSKTAILPLFLLFAAQPALSQTALAQPMIQRIAAFDTASALERPNIARQVVRDLRSLPQTEATRLLRTQALNLVSHQAAIDGRKDLALRMAQQAVDLSASLPGDDGKIARAKSAIRKTQALILREEYLAAMTIISKARLDYGSLALEADFVWDELLLWAAIAKASAPERLSREIEAIDTSEENEAMLVGPRSALCGRASGVAYQKIPGIGRAPVYPVLSAFSGLQGGVVMRSEIGADGNVINTRATAFAPTDGFAAAAENAVPTWRYTVPENAPAACLKNVITVLAFKLK